MIELRSATDEQLARRAQGGCAESFELLVRRFQVPLLQFLRKRVKSAADAEDIVQDTFVRAYERLGRYRDRWRFSTWIFTIANRCAVTHHRKRQAEDARMKRLAGQAGAAPESPERPVIEEESRRRFWDLAGRVLSDEQFAAVWLYYVEQMPTRQITRVLNCSWVSVKTTLYRARKRLAPHLTPARDEPMPFPARRALSTARMGT
jgi:RNA polymerase sigma-70 factor (ECF subfamily)